jgi:cell division initiation protein
MKVTPLEIRKKSFEKVFRGYDKDEVNAYLVSLSQAWEKVMDENKELTIKLDSAEKEIAKLREIENSLFKTLKTAEDTGANMIEQANKTAELHMKETQMNADALMSESESKARSMLEEAESNAREIMDSMQDEVKKIEGSHRQLQQQRDNLLREIKNIADGFLENVAKARGDQDKYSIDEIVKKAKKISKVNYSFEAVGNKYEAKEEPSAEAPNQRPQRTEPDHNNNPRAESTAEDGSFFDNLD